MPRVFMSVKFMSVNFISGYFMSSIFSQPVGLQLVLDFESPTTNKNRFFSEAVFLAVVVVTDCN